jgi:hypothetical protein
MDSSLKFIRLIQSLIHCCNASVCIYALVTGLISPSPQQDIYSCIYKPQNRPATCELFIDKSTSKKSDHNLIFLVLCFWIGIISIWQISRAIFRFHQRFLDGCILLLFSSLEVSMGKEFDELSFIALGISSLIVSLLLLVSIPCCTNSSTLKNNELKKNLMEEEGEEEYGTNITS